MMLMSVIYSKDHRPIPLNNVELDEVRASDNYFTRRGQAGFHIPAVKRMWLSNPLEDHLNPAYMPTDYFYGDRHRKPRYERPLPGYNVESLLRIGVRREIRTVHLARLSGVHKMNSYLRGELRRLLIARSDGDSRKYWRIAGQLLRHSTAFRIAGLHRTAPHWFKSLADPIKILSAVERISKGDVTDYAVRHFQIPKTDGTPRDIQCPSTEWRIYLGMINILVSLWVDNRLSDHQHGHRRNRGLGAAWQDILYSSFIDRRWMWEFDFAKFHPSLPYKWIRRGLDWARIPRTWINRLQKLNNPWVEGERDKPYKSGVGVPMGVATSAILGMIALEALRVYSRSFMYVGYADDGIIAADTDPVPEFMKMMEGTGIRVKPAKCRYVKKDGTWVRPLDFLGCRLRGFSEDPPIFCANTKNAVKMRGQPLNTHEFRMRTDNDQAWLTWKDFRENRRLLNLVIGRTFCRVSGVVDSVNWWNTLKDGSYGEAASQSNRVNIINLSSYSFKLLARGLRQLRKAKAS